MSYVIYNPTTWKIYRHANGSSAVYDLERLAKAQRTKLINAGVLTEAWKIDTDFNYHKNEPMITVKSLMSGEDVQIRASDVGGCCDPSTERYWSM